MAVARRYSWYQPCEASHMWNTSIFVIYLLLRCLFFGTPHQSPDHSWVRFHYQHLQNAAPIAWSWPTLRNTETPATDAIHILISIFGTVTDFSEDKKTSAVRDVGFYIHERTTCHWGKLMWNQDTTRSHSDVNDPFVIHCNFDNAVSTPAKKSQILHLSKNDTCDFTVFGFRWTPEHFRDSWAIGTVLCNTWWPQCV
jgi:hypothetical protein